MKKYIDAGLLKKVLNGFLNTTPHYILDYDCGFDDCVTAVQDTISDIPAADVMEIVRCKDCKWRGTEKCAMFYECDCGEQHTWETDDDFCSYGERADK